MHPRIRQSCGFMSESFHLASRVAYDLDVLHWKLLKGAQTLVIDLSRGSQLLQIGRTINVDSILYPVKT